MTRLFPALALLALAGCATISPEARVRAGLVNAGLSPRMAGCMAPRMVDRLSLVQLKRLQALGKVPKLDMRATSIDRLLYQMRALKDPEIVGVTSKAALVCAVEGL
jgi:hypothetical protein